MECFIKKLKNFNKRQVSVPEKSVRRT